MHRPRHALLVAALLLVGLVIAWALQTSQASQGQLATPVNETNRALERAVMRTELVFAPPPPAATAQGPGSLHGNSTVAVRVFIDMSDDVHTRTMTELHTAAARWAAGKRIERKVPSGLPLPASDALQRLATHRWR